MQEVKVQQSGCRKDARWLRKLPALAEDRGPVHRSNTVAPSYNFRVRGSNASVTSMDSCTQAVYLHSGTDT